MADLTLADVERLNKKAGPQIAEVRHWNDAMKNRVSNDNAVIYGINSYRFEAWRKLGEIVADDLDALLALAREALERRRDEAALDDDPDPEDTARQERLDSLLYHPPVPKDPY